MARWVDRLVGHTRGGRVIGEDHGRVHPSLLLWHLRGAAGPIEVVGDAVLSVRVEGHTYTREEL